MKSQYKAGGDARFAHRQNKDGTIDSICLHCFLTIASSKSIRTLAMTESRHRCDISLIALKDVQDENTRQPR